MRKHFLLGTFLLILLGACNKPKVQTSFVIIENGHFVKNGKPYYYVGTNFWYGAILASEGEGGNRKRLKAELDSLAAIGVDNLRILVGADGNNGVTAKVEPTLQKAPGVYNDTILAGLDYLLCELDKRDMKAILYLNNSWEWSGGYGQYLAWAGKGKAPIPAVDGWNNFQEFVRQYQKCDTAKMLFADHVKNIIMRTNRYTNKKYVDDSAIMSWQIGNEPRAFGEENKISYALWIHEVANLIRKLDPNHLISTGSEGYQGTEGDIQLWELIHSYRNVDYMTIHIWPYNWGWAKKDDLTETLDYSIKQTDIYIQKHVAIAEKHNKPVVIEEFGFPRDEFQFTIESTTTNRDKYYAFVFEQVLEHSKKQGALAGCNFWAWGGLAKKNSAHTFWVKGDDYMGDPAQEEQGLYSVFQTDKTTKMVGEYNKNINCVN